MERVYWVLTGPTASGKTAALLRQASTRPMLAISADSRQVYQHMSIGTGKPTAKDTRLLSHKVIDVISPLERFNAHTFVMHAASALEDAFQNGHEPWVVGGTGLYIRALVENLELGIPPRQKLRAALSHLFELGTANEVADKFGVTTADDLNAVRVARSIENACKNDARAAEIYQCAGLSQEDAQDDDCADDGNQHQNALATLSSWRCGGLVVIDPGKPELLESINIRVAGMFEDGLVEEVQELRNLGFGRVEVVTSGIGYCEAGQVLDSMLDVSQAIESTVIRTRQYAKRQRTYFKNRAWETIHPSQFDAWVNDRVMQETD